MKKRLAMITGLFLLMSTITFCLISWYDKNHTSIKNAQAIAECGPYEVRSMSLVRDTNLIMGDALILELRHAGTTVRLVVPCRARDDFNDIRVGEVIGFGVKSITIPPDGYIPDAEASYLLPFPSHF